MYNNTYISTQQNETESRQSTSSLYTDVVSGHSSLVIWWMNIEQQQQCKKPSKVKDGWWWPSLSQCALPSLCICQVYCQVLVNLCPLHSYYPHRLIFSHQIMINIFKVVGIDHFILAMILLPFYVMILWWYTDFYFSVCLGFAMRWVG